MSYYDYYFFIPGNNKPATYGPNDTILVDDVVK